MTQWPGVLGFRNKIRDEWAGRWRTKYDAATGGGSARTGLPIKNLIPTDPFGDADLADL